MGKKSHGGQARRRDREGNRPPRQRTNSSSDDGQQGQFAHDYSKDYKKQNKPNAVGQIDKGVRFVIIAAPIVIVTVMSYYWYQDFLCQQVRTPLDAPLMISPSATSAAEDSAKFWGTYRSGLYFGLKTRTLNSPVVGLMWMTQLTAEMPPPIRHWCEQGDGLPMYSWFAHDGVNFGVQEVMDKFYTVSTDFVKRPGGQHGGDWSAKVSLKPRVG